MSRRVYNKAYYQANKVWISKRQAAWRKANRDKVRAYQRVAAAKCVHINPSHKQLGVTREQFKLLLTTQNNECAICGSNSQHWCLDHNRATNQRRGILCRECNLALGKFKDNATYCRKAAAYLEHHEVLGNIL